MSNESMLSRDLDFSGTQRLLGSERRLFLLADISLDSASVSIHRNGREVWLTCPRGTPIWN